TTVVRDDPARTFTQRQGPTVVTKPGPRGEELVGPRLGKVGRCRPAVDEAPPRRPHALDPRLLRHHLGDEHLPGVRGFADLERPASRLVPPEQTAVEAARPYGGHRARIAAGEQRWPLRCPFPWRRPRGRRLRPRL